MYFVQGSDLILGVFIYRMRIGLFFTFIFWTQIFAQNFSKPEEVFRTNGEWAKKTLSEMSLDQKIGQLLMVPAYTTNNSMYNKAQIDKFISDYQIGGIIFMQGSPRKQAEHANEFQTKSKIPLLVGQDSEWGLNMRLDSCIKYPRNMALGALDNDSLLFDFGQEIARQCRAVGVHVNFAPVVDVNNNPKNPVIGTRSFGDNKHNVTQKSLMVMQGMQSKGVIATAKHFPGHGDTNVDSHIDLPVIKHSRQRIDSLELYPFTHMIKHGCMAMMVAHLYIPSLDPTPNQPSTMSKPIVQGMLRDSLGFQGLIFTDAMNMGGVTKFHKTGDAELKALKAGNDVLLFPGDVPLVVARIKEAVQKGEITENEIDNHVYRILLAKEWLNLHNQKLVAVDSVYKVLYSRNAKLLQTKLQKKSTSLIKNYQNTIPIKDLENKKMICVQMGKSEPSEFYKTLSTYASVDFLYFNENEDLALIKKKLLGYDYIFFGLYNIGKSAADRYNLTTPGIELVCEAALFNSKTVLCVFGNPYVLQFFGQESAIIVSYDEEANGQIAAAEAIFGGVAPEGLLPVNIPGKFKERAWYINDIQRFKFSEPEDVGVDYGVLSKIDTAVAHYIKVNAMPGCQILAIRGNSIIWHKGYGYCEYDTNSPPIDPLHVIYDLASVTKVASTTLAIMHLYDQKKISIYSPVSQYLPQLTNTKVGKIQIIDLLQHKSGLPAWESFWLKTLNKNNLDTSVVHFSPSDSFSIMIAEGLWLKNSFPEILWKVLPKVKPKKNPGVEYSDLGMIILAKIIEVVVKEPIDSYMQKNFYTPMGMDHTTFQPYQRKSKFITPPTEIETFFRKRKIQGVVHDPNAAVLGGISGHAGLFSNIYDLGKLLLMIKNDGTYGGHCYLDKQTVQYFTSKTYAKSRRGLGWDKPETSKDKESPVPDDASSSTFGHLGFTGTSVWVDPEFDIVYVFLSNRTFPNAAKNKIFTSESVRVQMMDLIYRGIKKHKQNLLNKSK